MRSTRRTFLLQTAALSLGPLERPNRLLATTLKPRTMVPQIAGLSLNPSALPKFVDHPRQGFEHDVCSAR